MTSFLLSQGQTALELVLFQLIALLVMLINHFCLWVVIGFPLFALDKILNGKLNFFLDPFILFGHSQVESNNFSVLREGKMFKRHKVLVIDRVQSCRGDQVT